MKRFLIDVLFISLVFGGSTLPLEAQQVAPANHASKSGFEKLEKLVWQYFESMDGFRETDLIAREDVEPLIKKLAAAGFTLKRPDNLLKLLLSKNDFLYTELYTNNGRKFMQSIADYPNGYDRLDRLSRLPRGKQTVHDLIRGPGGEKMIQYMTTSAGGEALGRQLSQAPNGANFNAPTDRIYTVQDLLDYLEEHLDAQKK